MRLFFLFILCTLALHSSPPAGGRMKFLNDLIGSDASIIIDFPGEDDDDNNGPRRRVSAPHRRERRRPIKWAASLSGGRQAILFLDDGRHCLIVGTSRAYFNEYLGEVDIVEALVAFGIGHHLNLINLLPDSIHRRIIQRAAS